VVGGRSQPFRRYAMLGRRTCFDHFPPEPAFQGGPRPHTALLLIDCQKAFLAGYWAHAFGLDQVAPIERAFRSTAELFQRPERLSGCAVLCTKCYTDGAEAEYDDALEPILRNVPCVWKPTTDVTRNPKFHVWFRERLEAGVRTLVIGGCTTTSCVRVSSQAIRRWSPTSDLRVVVDLSLCGARVDNHLPKAHEDPDLVQIYGLERCRGLSPVDLAIMQMRTNGVEVVESYNWDAPLENAATSAGCSKKESSE